jgi:D-glycerate 3-kinase
MPAQARQALARLVPGLLAQVPQEPTASLAIAGAPGSGKSTLAGLLTFLLNESGRPTVLLSLDDYYLARKHRQALAASRHALLRHRGAPGTHDWPRLLHDFDCLLRGEVNGLAMPVFDKSSDDIAAMNHWRSVDFTPSCLILEGWCIGAPAQDENSLARPINEWESKEDADGVWRHYVNEQLARYHRDLAERIDRFWYLEVPDWERVIDWRWQQERELARPRLRNRKAVADFLATFERIFRHMQESAQSWADLRLQADSLHCLQVMQ